MNVLGGSGPNWILGVQVDDGYYSFFQREESGYMPVLKTTQSFREREKKGKGGRRELLAGLFET